MVDEPVVLETTAFHEDANRALQGYAWQYVKPNNKINQNIFMYESLD